MFKRPKMFTKNGNFTPAGNLMLGQPGISTRGCLIASEFLADEERRWERLWELWQAAAKGFGAWRVDATVRHLKMVRGVRAAMGLPI